jgi:hypothetical protein
MVYKDLLELERTIRSLNQKLKDKPKGYRIEFKMNAQVFSEMNDQKIEIILIDPKKNLVAYRPQINGSSINENEKWLFGNYEKVVKDAFAWRKKARIEKSDANRFHNIGEDNKEPEYTLMSFL